MIIRDLTNLAWQRDTDAHDVKDTWPGSPRLLVPCSTRLGPAHDVALVILRGEGEMSWGHARLPVQGSLTVRVGAATGMENAPAGGGHGGDGLIPPGWRSPPRRDASRAGRGLRDRGARPDGTRRGNA